MARLAGRFPLTGEVNRVYLSFILLGLAVLFGRTVFLKRECPLAFKEPMETEDPKVSCRQAQDLPAAFGCSAGRCALSAAPLGARGRPTGRAGRP